MCQVSQLLKMYVVPEEATCSLHEYLLPITTGK